METVKQAENIFGDKLYQIRARRALPILVRQAFSKKPIFYDQIAFELEMPNPRNLNYVLGSIGTTLEEFGHRSEWGNIPHIQSLVINRRLKLPGDGFQEFLAERFEQYRELSVEEKRSYLDAYWEEIYAYPYWLNLLDQCKLIYNSSEEIKIIKGAKCSKKSGGGEGRRHFELKKFVVSNPELVGLPVGHPNGKPESPLPSGDRVDVMFKSKCYRLAVEVKSIISSIDDISRGLFQCVKYRAVMEAERGFKIGTHNIDAVLVVEGGFPDRLRPLQHCLGVSVVIVNLKDK